jgi:subtilisin-like proprotein convertase family protein
VQTTANPADIVAQSGVNITGRDFGNFRRVSLGGLVFHDRNGDGLAQAGDPGQRGVTVFLDADNDGTLDTGETSTTTDANGTYTFANVGPGTQRLRQVLPTGFAQTTANPADLLPQSGTNVTGRDFGLFERFSLSGVVYNDLNGNAVRDTGDPGLQGWTVFLDANDNGTPDTGEPTATSDANGGYTFANLGPGTYRPREVVQTGWVRTTPNPAPLAASSGFSPANVHFGNFRGGEVRGVVFNDQNNNRARDTGEPGLPGWVVYVDQNGNGTLEQQTVTAAATDVPKAIPDPGTVLAALAVSNAPGALLDVNVTLSLTHTWDDDLDVFLVSPAGTRVELFTDVGGSGNHFTDTVLDDEAAGAITAGSAPFTGSFRPEGILASLLGQGANGTWTLELSDDTGADAGTLVSWSLRFVLASEPITVSGATGAYALTILNPGTYQIREVVPAGWTQTLPGTPDFRYTVTLASGQTVADRDFGNNRPGGGGGVLLPDPDEGEGEDADVAVGADLFLALALEDRSVGADGRPGARAESRELPSATPSTAAAPMVVGGDGGPTWDLDGQLVDVLFAYGLGRKQGETPLDPLTADRITDAFSSTVDNWVV